MSGRIYKISFLFVCLIFLLPSFVKAEISKIVFTTQPQTISPGQISGTITTQLQDSNGISVSSPETIDIVFNSISPSGEFLSPSSGNPVTTTMSTGSANKNFRYRDNSEGTFTLTIAATGRTSGSHWSVTQLIVVSSSTLISTATSTATSTESISTTTELSTSAGSSSEAIPSSHYSSVALSTSVPIAPINLSAGRNRIGSVGSPIEFKVESDIGYTGSSIFKWNFGDGAEGIGDIVRHVYEYPGEYSVVLNASVAGRGEAVARATVLIVDPNLSIVMADKDRVEIKNSSTEEVSFFGRALWAHDNVFVFPQDTIIGSGRSISFNSHITGLHPNSIYETQLIVVGLTEQPRMQAKIDEEKAAIIKSIENKISLLQKQLAYVPSPMPSVESFPTSDIQTSFESLGTTEASQEAASLKGIQSGWLSILKKFFLGIK